MTIELVVGTYAAKGGAGLVPLRYDAEHDLWSPGEAFGHVRNASFGAPVSGSRALLVDEEAGRLALLDRAAGWASLVSVASGGAAPCHVALDPDEAFAAVANYASGDVGLFRLTEWGLAGPLAVHRNEGGGPDRERQDGPHAHWVGFSADGTRLISVDLGADRIFGLRVDRSAGALGEAVELYRAPPGSGPRHLAFHPRLPCAYLVNELAATLTVLEASDGGLVARTTLPITTAGDSLGGAVAIDADGICLHVTARGADRIVTFALDALGNATPLDEVPSGGASPRHLCLLPDHLLCANEKGGTVAIFRLDADRRPTDPRVMSIPGAAFITFGYARGLA